MKDIIEKIKHYDEEYETNFADIISKKVKETKNANSPYRRGILHGLLLALCHLDIILPDDAIVVLEEVAPNE